DTELMRANPGLVAKEGAEGLLGIGVPACVKYPQGLGIAMKLTQGELRRFGALVLAPLLTSLGLKSIHEPPLGQEARFHYAPHQDPQDPLIDISPLVHTGIAVWPGDVG